MTNTAHSHCTHPATKAARAKCRRERGQLQAEVVDIRNDRDPFALLPEVEDDWADADTLYDGPIYDPREGDADLLD